MCIFHTGYKQCRFHYKTNNKSSISQNREYPKENIAHRLRQRDICENFSRLSEKLLRNGAFAIFIYVFWSFREFFSRFFALLFFLRYCFIPYIFLRERALSPFPIVFRKTNNSHYIRTREECASVNCTEIQFPAAKIQRVPLFSHTTEIFLC